MWLVIAGADWMGTKMKNALGFSAKDRIDHSVYGPGTIVETNERLTTILFDEAGTKRFITAKVKLAASDTPAPAKPVRRKKKTTRST